MDPHAAVTMKTPKSLSKPTYSTIGMCVTITGFALVSTRLDNYGFEIGFQFLLLLVMAEAWNLLAGYTGLVSLGTAAFVGIGGYILVGLMNQYGIDVPVALLLSGLGAVVAAVLASRAVFRLRGLYFTIGTLALAEALRLFMVNCETLGGATGVFLSPDPPELKHLYWLAFATFVMTWSIIHACAESRLSVLFRAVRDDEDAAAQFGVRVFRIKLIAFAISSFIIGVAGGLQALKMGAIEPYGMFNLQWTVSVLTVVIIGGQGRRLGPVSGAFLVVLLGELFADYPAVHLLLLGLFLIIAIRFAPQGLVGLAEKVFVHAKFGGKRS
ncbi:branched-chain amino acid ABC transporter permease [Pseudomonas japonica]|uniref:Amino acid/amide ABC transporter membrane protein 2, HAAT family n=1 Tax=Pseudomonas japonica TaxID=256466 RepID=A0A239JI20_9PSED|nr:branched-chain amino acid ABC transporter permease [Pseudomonas japonica]SNT05222.1 amino acid/amide ABC transporter membrane protein 2, HAAT family [Pseudomonas japonica]